MATVRISALRHVGVALLVVVLTLFSVGRELTAAHATPETPIVVAGLAVPICHSDAGHAPTQPALPSHRDCCDDCAFSTQVALPGGARLLAPARVGHVATPTTAMISALAITRTPTPKLSQGPPTL